ncbi:MAG: S8 family peptidase [Lachnospiraceae bacterium]|nr:S8 family peptidase [Lachnospiraceae bacterium]
MQRVREQVGILSNTHGYTGKGVTVAVLDTGVGHHKDLSGRVLSFRDFVGNRKRMYDDNGHGTHVCGIICGNGRLSDGRFCGMAPEARLVVGKVLDKNGDGNADVMIEALKWIVQQHRQYQIRILNISVGIGTLDNVKKENELTQLMEAAWDSGIIVICAAGNKGPQNASISSVGKSNKVITVGCHDGEFCKDNPRRCESYSGRGDAFAIMKKPDIVAPGTDIISCNVEPVKMGRTHYAPYVAKSGTSMATPIISGAAALALQCYPDMNNEEFKQKLTLTATDLGEPWNKQGWGMLHVARLLE